MGSVIGAPSAAARVPTVSLVESARTVAAISCLPPHVVLAVLLLLLTSKPTKSAVLALRWEARVATEARLVTLRWRQTRLGRPACTVRRRSRPYSRLTKCWRRTAFAVVVRLQAILLSGHALLTIPALPSETRSRARERVTTHPTKTTALLMGSWLCRGAPVVVQVAEASAHTARAAHAGLLIVAKCACIGRRC